MHGIMAEYCNQTIHGVRVFSVVGSGLQYTRSLKVILTVG